MCAIAIAAKAIRPDIEIFGVETEVYPSMYNVLNGLDEVLGGDTIADGIAVKSPGTITREIVRRLVDEIFVVSEVSIEVAVQSMLIEAKLLVEGAGATPLAALQEHQERFAGKSVALVACGSNIDPRLLSSVLLRGMSREGHLARLRISITDQTGTLAKVTQIIGDAGGNIVETYHQRMFADVSVKRAELDAVVEMRDVAHAKEMIARLVSAGFCTRQLTERAGGG